MFMKTRGLIIGNKLKRKCDANNPLNNTKRQKTDNSSGLGDPVGHSRESCIENVDDVVEESQMLVSGSSKKDGKINRKLKRNVSSIIRKHLDRRKKIKRDANKPLINTKKQKTEDSSSLGKTGHNRKSCIEDVDDVVDESRALISGSSKDTKVNKKLKRKLSSALRKSIGGRKKRKMELEPVDRISELPEHIIHHILSRLRCPKDVTRTTVWSKKWRSTWASFFTFDFDQRKFNSSERNHPGEFITFVDTTLARKLEPMHNIQKFKIFLSQPSMRFMSPMNNWIKAAINKDVKELEVHVEEDKLRKQYILPNPVFTSNNLTSLRLYGCRFMDDITINLCNLKELSIKNAHANADVINNFIRCCPLVEDLRLIQCKGISQLHISTLKNLKKVHVHECNGLMLVNIKSTSILYFWFWAKNLWKCFLDLEGCENLKSLSLKYPNMTDRVFQELITKFPCLEKVVLRECNNLKRITILSRTLKELSVIRCKKLKDPLIDAPNLYAFEYSGGRMPFDLTRIPGLHEAKLHLQIGKRGSVHELEHALQKFEKNGGWKLVVSSSKNITIHQEIPKIQNITIHEELPKIKHSPSKEIKLEFTKSSAKLNDYVDNLLRMSRPKTLSLVSSSSYELLNFLKEKILLREKNPRCCTYYQKKCWLHHIKDVTMVVRFEDAELEGVSGELQQTTFRFKW